MENVTIKPSRYIFILKSSAKGRATRLTVLGKQTYRDRPIPEGMMFQPPDESMVKKYPKGTVFAVKGFKTKMLKHATVYTGTDLYPVNEIACGFADQPTDAILEEWYKYAEGAL